MRSSSRPRSPTRGLSESIRALIDEAREAKRQAERDKVHGLIELARDPEVPVAEILRALEAGLSSPELRSHPQLLLTHLEVVFEHRLWPFDAIARRSQREHRSDQTGFRGAIGSIRREAVEAHRHQLASMAPTA